MCRARATGSGSAQAGSSTLLHNDGCSLSPLQRATDLNAGKAGAVLGGRTRIGRLVYGYLVTVVAYSRSSLSDCPLHYYFVNRP